MKDKKRNRVHHNQSSLDAYNKGYRKGLENARKALEKSIVGGTKQQSEYEELHPAWKFVKRLTFIEQIGKIYKELDEVMHAWTNGESLNRIGEELVDVQTACETEMANIGLTYAQRNAIRRRVYEKNKIRDYLKKQEGED